MRPNFLSIAVVCFLAMSIFGPRLCEAAQKKSPPNVLFIAIDDLNDWVGVLGGHPQARTPNIDKFCRSGVLFTKAYCAAPSCNPSRAALLTGRRPSSSGVYFNSQDWRQPLADFITLPAYFMQNNYLVWGGGKIFHGRYPAAKVWHEYYRGKNKLPKKKFPKNGIGGNMTWGPLPADDKVMPDTQMTDWAIKKLNQKQAKPFFLAVGYIKPHLTWHAPQKYFKMHPLKKVLLPKVNESDLNDIPPPGIKLAKRSGDHAKIRKKGNWQEAVQAYLATSTYMDAQLGRLLEALANSPHAENTIIILWSDHGWHLGEKEHWRKFALWEDACRVPMAMRVPGLTQPNQKCERPVNLLDIYPTLVELCHLPGNKKLQGNSLVPLLKNPKQNWEFPSITTYGRNNHAVRLNHYRYIRYSDGSEELYDQSKDPHEWTNLANDSKYRQIKLKLAKHLPKVNVKEAPKSLRKKKGKGKKKKKIKPTINYPSPISQLILPTIGPRIGLLPGIPTTTTTGCPTEFRVCNPPLV